MASFDTHDICLHYEVRGERGKPPVFLIAGLDGVGTSWGGQVDRFAKDHYVVVADQRGTGKTTRATSGYSIPQLATDFAALLRHLDVGPVHLVGASTGGAIAQVMALNDRALVRSLTLGASYARPDAFVRRQFELRRALLVEADMHLVYTTYALFLFSPRFTRDHPERVASWIARLERTHPERDIALARTDMAMAHDTSQRLGEIDRPTLVLGGDQDFCVPLGHSDELARGIRGAERVVLSGGHLLHDEDEAGYFVAVRDFLRRH